MIKVDKSLGIKINTNANSAVNSINRITNSLKLMGYNVKKVRQVADEFGNIGKTTVTATKGIQTVNKTLDKTGKVIKSVTTEASRGKNAFSQMFNFGKIYAFWNVTKRLRDGIKQMITSAIDFIETTNKFEVSMGKMEKSGYKFIDKMSEKFGLAREELMNYQSTYNNIMKSLSGITDETAYKVSESITKMAVDYASLYNVSTEESMTKFQSALVGSVRPIRSESGYDITETTIGEKAKELGVESPVRQLTQMEKRLLRIIVLMDQMKQTGAMGDFARTIEQPANQLKVLSNQLKELGMWLGNVFIGTIGKILPYVNGFVMALKEIAKALALFVGYENVGNVEGPLEEMDEYSGNTADNLGSAVASAKELKKTLMGFDVLNVIQSPSSGSGGGAGGSIGGVDPKILNALKEYDNLMEGVSMKATQIRDKILAWLGFTRDANGELKWAKDTLLKNIYDWWDKIDWKIKGLLGIFATVKVSSALLTLITGLATIKTSLGALGLIKGGATIGAGAAAGTAATGAATAGTAAAGAGLASTALTIAAVAAVALPLFTAIWGLREINKPAVDFQQTLQDIADGMSEANKNAIEPFIQNFQTLGTTIAGINISDNIITAEDVDNISLQVNNLVSQLKTSLDEDYAEVTKILDNVEWFPNEEKRQQLLKQAKDYHEDQKKIVDDYSKQIKKIYEKASKENRKLTESEKNEINRLQKEMANTGIDILSDSNKETIKLKERFNKNYNSLTTEQVSETIKQAKKLKDDTIAAAEDEYAEKLALAEGYKDKMPELYAALTASAEKEYEEQKKAAEKNYTDILLAAQKSYPEIIDYIDTETGEIKGSWEILTDAIGALFGKAKTNIKTEVDETAYLTFHTLQGTVKDIRGLNPELKIESNVKSVVQDINDKIAGIKSTKTVNIYAEMRIKRVTANASGGGTTGGIKGALGATAFDFLKYGGLQVAPYYATGGFPSIGEMFVAREAGPELVGTIGNKSAVVNNDQIVEAVSQGVAQAVSSVMGSNGGSYHLYIDGQEITDVVSRRMSRMANITGGGYVYEQ